jgi:hypothetical protein
MDDHPAGTCLACRPSSQGAADFWNPTAAKIRDNGPDGANTYGHGLTLMAERVSSIGGDLHITSPLAKGQLSAPSCSTAFEPKLGSGAPARLKLSFQNGTITISSMSDERRSASTLP